ncbi:MAG TPA: hypothetical protein VLZ75_04035 [Chitinophagales bacterium]|nr:hypothetical protein [Chitinophagales bacterium]
MITQYIYDLLLDNDYVVVPGLGGFVCQYQSSILDRQRAHIQPPARTIAFNKALQQNDGLLVQHLVLRDQLNYKDAEDKVRQYVAQCNQQLHQIGSIQFPKIGRLYMDELKNIQFTPTYELLPFDDTFGFNPVRLQAISRAEEEETDIVEINPTPVITIQRQKRWPYWMAASFAGLLLMGSVWMNLGQPTFQNVLTAGVFSGNIVNITNQQNQIPINNQQIQSEFLTDLVIKNAEANLAKEPVATIEEIEEVNAEPTFQVVVGAFKGNKKATQFKEALEAKGYQIDLVTTPNNSFIKVVVNYTAIDEAAALGHIRSSIEKEAWLLN